MFIFGFSTAKQTAINSLVVKAQQKAPTQRERELKVLSVISLRNDSVQEALADYYTSINRYDLAGETLAKGSTQLSAESAKYYGEAGEYTLARSKLEAIPTKQLTTASRAEMARVAFNLNDIDRGCNLAEKAESTELISACKILRGQVSREASYQLIGWRIYAPAVRALEKVSPKTAGDWLTLARISVHQRKSTLAADQLSQAIQAFPFDRGVAQTAVDLCKQQGSEVPACTQLSEKAQQTLNETNFKS